MACMARSKYHIFYTTYYVEARKTAFPCCAERSASALHAVQIRASRLPNSTSRVFMCAFSI
jgi:cytidine deaminase